MNRLLVLMLSALLFAYPANAARVFNGSSQSMESASSIDLSGTNVVTISWWFKATTWPSSSYEYHFELGTDASSVNDAFNYGDYNAATQTPLLLGNVGIVAADYSPDIATGQWVNYVAIFDKSKPGGAGSEEVAYYVDGSAQTADTWTGQSTNNTNNFGNRILYFMARASSSMWRDGEIADIAIWTSSLSGGNISSLASGTLPSAISPSPAYYWKVCGSASPEPASIGGINLTLVGGPTQSSHPSTITSSCAAGSLRRAAPILFP